MILLHRLVFPFEVCDIIVYTCRGFELIKQAGAELCQAQVKLKIMVYIGVKVEVEIVAEVGSQLFVRVVGGEWVDGLKRK